MQNEKIISYEDQVARLQKEVKKLNNKIHKYKQLKELSDMEINKLRESQQEQLNEHTSKMK